MCINWILLLKNVIVSCRISSRLPYLFILYVWFENIWLISTVRTKRKIIGLWSVNKTVECLDPSIKNSYSVSVYNIAVHSLIRVESLSLACVNSAEFAELRFILFVPL